MTFIPNQPFAQTAFGELAVSQLTPRIQLTFPYGLNANFVTGTLSGSNSNVYTSGSMLFVETGATQYSSASVRSIDVLKYDPGQGAMARFTAGFTPPKNGSVQWAGLGNDGIDGFYFGYSGSNFGILHRSASIDTFITQSSWLYDKADGTGHIEALDFTKLNVFQIQYQFLGGGNIGFYVADPTHNNAGCAAFYHLHTIKYANAHYGSSLTNPSMNLRLIAQNMANNTMIKTRCASMAAFIEGVDNNLGYANSTVQSKGGIGTTLTNIMTLKNNTTFNGVFNQVRVQFTNFSFAVAGTQPAEIRVIKNAMLGGSPSYTDIDTQNSVISIDVAGTTVTGGQAIFSMALPKDGSDVIDATNRGYRLHPGETLTFALRATQNTTSGSFAASWLSRH